MIIGSKQTIRLHANDNVVIALSDLAEGSKLNEFDVTLLSYVPRGHKVAVKNIAKGDNVIRYGQIIGQATQAIAVGEHVHVQNMGMGEHLQDYAFSQSSNSLPPILIPRTFNGYHRENGKVGTRNYLGILTSVNCAGSVARFIEEAATKTDFLKEYPNIDGIVPIVHSTGCGMSGQGEGYQTLHRTLTGYANNPNFGGILLVGLGCEVLQVSSLVDSQEPSAAFRYMTIQSEGGTRKTIEKGLQELHLLAQEANKATREPAPVSEIMVGMQCGGSDGYSGITANPALGYASDLLVRHGGTTILSETSEVYGAEHLLTRRAVSTEVGQKLIDRIHWWEDYCARNGGEMDNNPSPGNKNGGLTTILEKSLGAVAKSGSAPLTDVYLFGEAIDKKGFVFMDSPGFDPCSVTGQVASGANMIIFTTGRGSVSGYKPTPCIKLATNTEMYRRLQEDMDLNCGDIVTAGVSIEEKGKELFELIIRIASGEETKSEALGFGGAEFVPWQIGAVM
ncbi:MAG: altronate dehydratase family protein [Gammaproteobacteria bacterium]|nr:altronate dehydratase family protein [Gammaproteobacteria bacterium]MBU1467558.1 altronate dehydratase family protein [Gammaproteobacteria bacterium]MBU2024677.1 altronate dehydratase family protein [Gammaproteobacteria bacterium]MBU2239423.1 altronate dehydratase family protein [Gammaproteobacteria bacterium]MBU2320588.1 altronate dehydratase family protein [Gammaproteobacteria bacterium]